MLKPSLVEPAKADRADLDTYFSGWMAEAEGKIRKMPPAERKEMRNELYGYAIDVARGLGDARGAQLLQMMPQYMVYGVALDGDVLTRGRTETTLQPGAAERLRAEIVEGASAIGLRGDRIASRLETGAANAWEERDWVRSDLLVVAGRRRLDLRNPDQGRRVADELQGFYDSAARTIDHSVAGEALPEEDRLVQTLRSMGRIIKAGGQVEFRGDAHAKRFADELRARYGDRIVTDLAAGRTQRLECDLKDGSERRWIAQAVVSAANSHAALGLTLKEAMAAERRLASPPGKSNKQDWER